MSSTGEYKFCCPYHNDKSPSAQFNVEKGVFKCFGCGAVAGYRKFFEYIGVLLPTSFQEVVFREPPKEFDSYESFISNYSNSMELGYWLLASAKVFNFDNFPNDFPEVFAYIEGRLYHPEVKNGFGMPIDCAYHKKRNSILFRTRFNIVEKFLEGKYVNYGDPAHLFTDTVDATGKLVVLVEGVFDWLVLRQLEYAGYDFRSASMLGTAITDVKLNDLAFLNPKEVSLAYDNDSAGYKAFERFSGVITSNYPTATKVPWKEGFKDFGDMCYSDITNLINLRFPILSYYKDFEFTY